MKNKMLLYACLLLLSAGARAGSKEPVSRLPGVGAAPAIKFSRYYFILGGGAAFPFGGHWGDADIGFKPAPAVTFAAAKKADETLSYGLETSYGPGHKSGTTPEMKIRIFSFTPFLRVAYPGAGKIYYGIFGAGVYH
jgi:hypothetical protein